MARQGQGRAVPADEHEALLTAVRFRRGLLGERKAAQQRLHDQVNGLCPGLSTPVGQDRKLELSGVAGQAFLDCLVDFGGRPAAARSLQARATGRLTATDAQYWAQRWKDCLPAPADAAVRVERLTRNSSRWRQLSADITAVETDMTRLLALTDGQVLTTLPGVKQVRRVLQRLHPADHTVPHRRAPVLRDRPGPRQLPVLQHRPTRRHQPPRTARAP